MGGTGRERKEEEEGRGAGSSCGHCPAPWSGWAFHCPLSYNRSRNGSISSNSDTSPSSCRGISLVLTITEATALYPVIGRRKQGTGHQKEAAQKDTGVGSAASTGICLSLGVPSPVNLSAGPRGTHDTPSHPSSPPFLHHFCPWPSDPNTGAQVS